MGPAPDTCEVPGGAQGASEKDWEKILHEGGEEVDVQPCQPPAPPQWLHCSAKGMGGYKGTRNGTVCGESGTVTVGPVKPALGNWAKPVNHQLLSAFAGLCHCKQTPCGVSGSCPSCGRARGGGGGGKGDAQIIAQSPCWPRAGLETSLRDWGLHFSALICELKLCRGKGERKKRARLGQAQAKALDGEQISSCGEQALLYEAVPLRRRAGGEREKEVSSLN